RRSRQLVSVPAQRRNGLTHRLGRLLLSLTPIRVQLPSTAVVVASPATAVAGIETFSHAVPTRFPHQHGTSQGSASGRAALRRLYRPALPGAGPDRHRRRALVTRSQLVLERLTLSGEVPGQPR